MLGEHQRAEHVRRVRARHLPAVGERDGVCRLPPWLVLRRWRSGAVLCCDIVWRGMAWHGIAGMSCRPCVSEPPLCMPCNPGAHGVSPHIILHATPMPSRCPRRVPPAVSARARTRRAAPQATARRLPRATMPPRVRQARSHAPPAASPRLPAPERARRARRARMRRRRRRLRARCARRARTAAPSAEPRLRACARQARGAARACLIWAWRAVEHLPNMAGAGSSALTNIHSNL